MLHILLLLSFVSLSFGYLDPGTGSMLLYFVIGIFTTFIYTIKGFIYKTTAMLTGKKLSKDLRDLGDTNILFYSEGEQYANLFLPIIQELENKKVKSAYYTSSQNDILLKSNFQYLTTKFIGSDMKSFALLNNIKVQIVIMTTPQIWKKSFLFKMNFLMH
jgi:hypothetical protein